MASAAASQSRCRITHRLQLVSCHLAALYLGTCVSTYLYLQLKSRIYISTHVLCLFTHRYCLVCFCFAFYVSQSVALLMLYTYIYNLRLSGSLCDCPLTHTQMYIRMYMRIYQFTWPPLARCLLYSTRQSILMGQEELDEFNCHIEILMHWKYRDIFTNDS